MTDGQKRTPLHDAHVALGGRMVPFAGYDMPVQYKDGIMAEHKWTREHAGLFDVSHMGPSFLTLAAPSGDADADHAAVSAIVETLMPGEVVKLAPGKFRYSVIMNGEGGILDDFLVGRPQDPGQQASLYVVVNAGTKDDDFALIEQAAGDAARIRREDHNALLALQGPEAAAVMMSIAPEAAKLAFMEYDWFEWEGEQVAISRTGYTGEDGFECLVPKAAAQRFWDRLLSDERVRPIGLGARDSLRLEAGLPLYGHDLDQTTSPIEASLNFAVNKRRREARDFPGAGRVMAELDGAVKRLRVGLLVEGAPAREGAEIRTEAGEAVGVVTSGGFSPTLGRPIAMGYVRPDLAASGTKLVVVVRGRDQAAEVTPMPFVPHRYFRG
jgi:aminomethyltransferase